MWAYIFTDQIALPDFSAGAMENWGLTMYRESALLYKEGVSSSSDKEWITIVVAHELAHQVQLFTTASVSVQRNLTAKRFA